MYYSSGNYEAFARPVKPEGVEHKSAYLVGSGLAALTAACYLVRDGQMPGRNIHILEKEPIAGGACDGWHYEGLGYVMRGGREMDNHFEVMWDLFRSIPSIETEGVSVLDEYYWLNKRDPNYSLMRATVNRGEDAHTDGKFGLSDQGAMEIMKLFFTPDEALYDRPITDVFSSAVLESNFWLYWRTMFAFENWHSALEMKLYLKRFIHHVGGLPDFTALRFTRYNQYESMILPMLKYLEAHGVQFHFNTRVVDVEFDLRPGRKQASRLVLLRDGAEEHIDLTENDLVFLTPGGCVENSALGSQDSPAPFRPELKPGGGWDMWRRIAARDPAFGRPDKFCSQPELSNWMSATVTTLDDKIPPYVQRICQRDPFSGKVVTGGIVTARDSNWLLSWTFNRQPQFRDQPRGQLVGWIYGLFSDKPGNFVKKPMRECTGREICMEWLYHMGVRGGDCGAGRPQRQHRPLHDALHHRLLPAPGRRRPASRRSRRGGELRLPGAVRRDGAGHHLYHRVLHAHRYGGGLHPAGHRPGRARGVGLHLRRAGSDQRLRPAAGRPQAHRAGAEPGRAPCPQGGTQKAPWHRPGEAAPGLPRHLTRPAPALSKSAGAGARQKGLLNASGRPKWLFICETASRAVPGRPSCPPFSGGPGRGRCR